MREIIGEFNTAKCFTGQLSWGGFYLLKTYLNILTSEIFRAIMAVNKFGFGGFSNESFTRYSRLYRARCKS